jgi:hypothetical protein
LLSLGVDAKDILLTDELFKPNQNVNHVKTTDTKRPKINIKFHILNKYVETNLAVCEFVLVVA